MVGALCWREGANDRPYGGPEAINGSLSRLGLNDLELGGGVQWGLGELGQCDRWISCLPAALLSQTGSEQDTTGAAHTQPVVEGEKGIGDGQLLIMSERPGDHRGRFDGPKQTGVPQRRLALPGGDDGWDGSGMPRVARGPTHETAWWPDRARDPARRE